MARKKTGIKITIWLIVFILFIAIAFVLGNAIYLASSFSRTPDKQKLELSYVQAPGSLKSAMLSNGLTYTVVSYNAGYGAYTPTYSSIIDGGDESRAESKDAVVKNTNDIANIIAGQDADFVSLQEVDVESDRSYNVDESQIIRGAMLNYSNVNAISANSSFLFWPPWKPYGKTKSNIMSLSKYDPTESLRRQLPIDEGPNGIFEKDCCYTITRYETNNGKDLIFYNVQTATLSKDPETSKKQLQTIIKDMNGEFEKGNYAICATDFNKQLVPSPGSYFPANLVKATPDFPSELLQGTSINLIAPFNPAAPVGTYRDSSSPLTANSAVANVDGFLVSSNITVVDSDIINTGYAYSNHNPVYLSFRLL